MSNKERIILILLASLNFTHILDFMIMMPLGNFLMPHFNISAQAFSVVVAAYTFSAGTVGFTAAFFVDRFDRKKVLLFGYSGFLLGTLACALAPTYGLLLAARILAGGFGGLIGAQVLSIVADLIPYERRATAMGFIMAAFSMASVVGVPFALYLAGHINWHAPFFFVVAMGAVLMPLLLRYIPKMDGHLKAAKDNRVHPIEMIKSIAADKNQLLALSLTSTMMMGHFLIIPFLNPFMEFNMGFSAKTQTPMVYFVGGFLTLFTSPIIGRISDKTGKFKVFSTMLLAGLLPVVFITNMPHVPFALVLCVTGFWFVVSSGRAIPAQAMVSNVVPPQKRGSFMSFGTSIQQMFVGLSSLLAGMIVVKTPDNTIHNYNITGYLSIAILLGCLVIGYLLNRAMVIIQSPIKQANL
ncbi:MFS transporter [Chitinophagaceae bacterium IBVUCB1]|nr:MFS transporter [Chitinophagaceae bacterium IBVUCB1]